jgi:hypothetical protein
VGQTKSGLGLLLLLGGPTVVEPHVLVLVQVLVLDVVRIRTFERGPLALE